MKTKSPRGNEDRSALQRALSLCEGDEEEFLTFKEWLKQLDKGEMADIGPKRRAVVRNFTLAAEDAGQVAKLPMPKRELNTRAELKESMAERILCGPLPAAPPGVTGNQPRFGRRVS